MRGVPNSLSTVVRVPISEGEEGLFGFSITTRLRGRKSRCSVKGRRMIREGVPFGKIFSWTGRPSEESVEVRRSTTSSRESSGGSSSPRTIQGRYRVPARSGAYQTAFSGLRIRRSARKGLVHLQEACRSGVVGNG